jgi:zinc/manganese transport system substrate-binding protein
MILTSVLGVPLLPWTIALLAVALGLAACGESAREGKGLEVVATTTQVADMAREVGGDRVRVRGLLRPNTDPHDYEPRPSDAAALAGARVVFRSGGELDDWLSELVESAGGDAPTVTLAAALPRGSGTGDPHWWHDPRNGEAAARAMARELGRVDPGGRAAYERRGRDYARRIARVDRRLAACFAGVPARQRKLVTTHDAFGRLARRYDVEVVGALIPSRSTQAQPSARDTRRLVEQIARERVRAIFPESSLDPRLERAVARETGAKVGGELWADSLGPPGSSGGTYLRSLAANGRALVRGMSGGARDCRQLGSARTRPSRAPFA